MARTICYRTKEPTYYNRGTKYETTCNEFLAYYTYKTMEEAQAEAERLNREKPERLFNGEKIDWNKIDYFFAHEQEEMY